MLKAAKAYLVTQVSTSSQGDLLLMLYDTAIKHLHQSIEKMQAKDMAGKGVLISKAINIISELPESLNKERGGDISKNLFQLYFYCNTKLLTANLKMKPEMVEEVIAILSGLRQAFAQIMPSADGVASLTQQGVTHEALATAQESAALGQAPTEPVPGASPAAEPEPSPAGTAAPVNPVRFRAANAYATSR
jgi:flagellar protein FliS